MRTGLPSTMAPAGTSRVTTHPAPIVADSPTVIPASNVAFAPIDARFRIHVLNGAGGSGFDRGNRSLNVAFGPTNTSSSSMAPSQSTTPFLTVTRSPITTLFSITIPAPRSQWDPMRAPGRMWAKASILVPVPTWRLSHNARGWMKTFSGAFATARSLESDVLADDRERPLLRVLERSP